jgi:uncharacterized protein YbjT (DUF2867 family)
MRIFLAGGTGFVGSHLKRALVAKGHSVNLLVHNRGAAMEPGIEEIEGDATMLPTFIDGVKGCDAVINLIGIIREARGRGITFERLHVEATRNMLSAAQAVGVKRLLQMSALGTRAGSGSGYFRSKFKAEEEVRASGLDYTIFRPSIIFGPGDAFVNQFAKILRISPVMPVIGDGKYQMQPISVDDVARCFVDALQMPETIGKTYQLCGPDRMTFNEILDTIGRALGKDRVLKIRNPLFLMRLIVPVLEGFPLFPISSDQLAMLVEGSICDGAWRNTFGFGPTRFEEGIRKYLKP